VIEQLEKSNYFDDNICVHGYKTAIKDRTLKRRTTILKHSRFLANLVVTPNVPKIIEKKEEKPEDEWFLNNYI